MRGTRDICLFCRHAINLRNSPRTAKRFVSQKHREPYVLPRLVIDLDAADSKYVRKVEELEDWHLATSQLREYTIKKHNSPRIRQEWPPRKLPFKLTQVTPPDLLTFALMGNPEPPGLNSRTTDNLRNIFRHHRVRRTDNTNEKVAVLSSEFDPGAQHRLEKILYEETQESISKQEALVWQMRTCHRRSGFSELIRLVTMLSSTKGGCIFLVKTSRHLLAAIKECRKCQKQEDPRTQISSDAVLLLLNNLRLTMESKGVKTGLVLCSTGLLYAAKSWNLSSLRTYLELLSKIDGGQRVHQTAMNALKSVFYNLLDHPEKAAGPQGSAALELVTGWGGNNHPVGHKLRGLSFLSTMDGNVPGKVMISYLVGLAEIGRKDILMAEWEVNRESDVDRFWLRRPLLKARAYAAIFQLLGDTTQALSFLSPWRILPGSNEGTVQSDLSQPSREHFKVASDGTSDFPASEIQIPVEMVENGQSSVDTATNSLESAQQSIETKVDADGVANPPPSEVQERMRILKEEQDEKNSPTKYAPTAHFLGKLLIAHYDYHNIQPSESLREAIYKALETIPTDPEQFLTTFEQFIIRGYRAPLSSNPKSMKECHWIDTNGVQGLVIFSEDRDTPLYWKTVSQAVL